MLSLLPFPEARSLPSRAYVYGSGTFAERVIQELIKCNIEIIGIVNHLNEPTFHPEIPKYSIDSELNIKECVILGFHNFQADIRRISMSLLSAGFREIWTPPVLVRALKQLGGDLDAYWLTGDDYKIHEAVLRAPNLEKSLSDPLSKTVLADVLNYRITGEVSHLESKQPLTDQYFPTDIKLNSESSLDGLYIDIGAFDGDTLRGIKSRSIKPKGYIGFEPDPKNFSKLQEEAYETLFPCTILPLAVSNKIETLLLSSNNSGSSISLSGETAIQTATLDSILHGQKVSLIKMDIEGAESDAIEGAVETIIKWNPVLALSVYHKPEDIWSIFEQVNSIGTYSKFHLRTYGEQTFDTILYCVP